MLATRDEDKAKSYRQNSVHTLHFYDSAFGSTYAGGSLFTYNQPYPYFTHYRVQNVSISDFPGFGAIDVFYLTSTIVSGSYASYRNGVPHAIICCIPRSTPTGPCVFDDTRYPTIPVGRTLLQNVQFRLLDQNFQPVNTRFFVTLKINICF